MKDNILVAVLLAIALVTPAFAWLFYIWYRSHLAQLHQEARIINRRDQDRAQANYVPANGDQNALFGPYFTPRGWVRPKARRLSHVPCPPQYVHPRQPIFTGNPNSDQPFQGQNQASTHSPQLVNQQPNQPNPLSKRQQRKQRALQNKQRQQREREQQQSQNEQQGKQNQQTQPKQNYKNQEQNHQKPPSTHSPNAQEGHDEQNHGWGNTEAQNDLTNNHGGGGGWGDDEGSRDNQHNTGQNEDNNDWGNNINNDQREMMNSGSHSPRQGSRDNHHSPREKSSQWGEEHHDDHRRSNGRRESDEQQQHQHNGWSNSRPDSPHQVSRKEADFSDGWGQGNNGEQQNSYSNEEHNRHDEWGNDDAKYKKGKESYHASSERRSRGQSSPKRDWGQNDHEEWGNSRGHAEEYHGGGSPARNQDHNAHRDKKKKKQRWEIELEENEKRRRRNRNGSRERSDAAYEERTQPSGWKETQEW